MSRSQIFKTVHTIYKTRWVVQVTCSQRWSATSWRAHETLRTYLRGKDREGVAERHSDGSTRDGKNKLSQCIVCFFFTKSKWILTCNTNALLGYIVSFCVWTRSGWKSAPQVTFPLQSFQQHRSLPPFYSHFSRDPYFYILSHTHRAKKEAVD